MSHGDVTLCRRQCEVRGRQEVADGLVEEEQASVDCNPGEDRYDALGYRTRVGSRAPVAVGVLRLMNQAAAAYNEERAHPGDGLRSVVGRLEQGPVDSRCSGARGCPGSRQVEWCLQSRNGRAVAAGSDAEDESEHRRPECPSSGLDACGHEDPYGPARVGISDGFGGFRGVGNRCGLGV